MTHERDVSGMGLSQWQTRGVWVQREKKGGRKRWTLSVFHEDEDLKGRISGWESVQIVPLTKSTCN